MNQSGATDTARPDTVVQMTKVCALAAAQDEGERSNGGSRWDLRASKTRTCLELLSFSNYTRIDVSFRTFSVGKSRGSEQ